MYLSLLCTSSNPSITWWCRGMFRAFSAFNELISFCKLCMEDYKNSFDNLMDWLIIWLSDYVMWRSIWPKLTSFGLDWCEIVRKLLVAVKGATPSDVLRPILEGWEDGDGRYIEPDDGCGLVTGEAYGSAGTIVKDFIVEGSPTRLRPYSWEGLHTKRLYNEYNVTHVFT